MTSSVSEVFTPGPTVPASTKPAPSASQAEESHRGVPLQSVLGGVFGGTAALILVIAFLLSRSRRSRKKQLESHLYTTPAPFTSTSAAAVSSKLNERLLISQRTPGASRQAGGSTDPGSHPAAGSSGVAGSSDNMEIPSIHGIYRMLATLMTRIPSSTTVEEEPPQYEDIRRSGLTLVGPRLDRC